MEQVGKAKVFFQRYDAFNLVKDLVFNGYAVFSLDANERTMGDQSGDDAIRWDTKKPNNISVANNVDVKNIANLRDSVIRDFAFPSDIPFFSVGMSNGSNFSDVCGSVLKFKASAHITAKGLNGTYDRDDILPIIWIMSENDHNKSADNDAAFTYYNQMKENQIAQWYIFKRSPSYPKRYVRSLNNVSEKQSDSIHQRLLDHNYLDSLGLLTVLDITTIPADILNKLGLNGQQKLDILQQFKMINADHVLHSDYNKHIIKFFNERLTPSSLISNISTNKNIFIYPNPSKDIINIDLKDEHIGKASIEIIDITGRLIYSEQVRKQYKDFNYKVELGSINNGTYIFSFVANERRTSQIFEVVK